jgi:hypothetical protein
MASSSGFLDSLKKSFSFEKKTHKTKKGRTYTQTHIRNKKTGRFASKKKYLRRAKVKETYEPGSRKAKGGYMEILIKYHVVNYRRTKNKKRLNDYRKKRGLSKDIDPDSTGSFFVFHKFSRNERDSAEIANMIAEDEKKFINAVNSDFEGNEVFGSAEVSVSEIEVTHKIGYVEDE